jgi:SAM-dependent methyltransferase
MFEVDGEPIQSPESDPELERRLAAEREFHNRKFGEAQEHGAPDSIYALPKAAYRAFEHELQSRAAGAEILEYGCGDCSYLAQLIEWGGRVTAIDISDEAIVAARELAVERGFADRASFARMNAEDLSFPDDSFDLIVGRAILHHLDLEKAYTSIARVLRPGGTAVFLEPLGHNPIINLYRRFTPHLRTEDEHPLLMRDIALAKRHFDCVRLEHFTLLSMGTLAVAKVPALWNPTLKALDALDARLFKLLPAAGRWAWTVSMVMSRPRKR